ncbi:hypothetical protein HBN50_00900 [Halobacteriovorax sp. GB3]|uniref:hypothetical protein n=1 Tax=Halobacteriovorax sp. GB3 TaxID=2719615 RepID=UPI002360820F|nr:hypothetical protein [Halobacteriovorax sp. GB3]MDD0851624.1 hypothetical protein [Halobacteriovorax sp. GB3]
MNCLINKYFLFFLLIVFSHPLRAWDKLALFEFQTFSVEGANEGNEQRIQYQKKLDYSGSFFRRDRFDKTEYLLNGEKSFEPIKKLFLHPGATVGINSETFEKYSLSLNADYYGIIPFNFSGFISFKKYDLADVILFSPSVHWETKIGLLLMGQVFYGNLIADRGSKATMAYSLKAVYLNSVFRPYAFYSIGEEAAVLLENLKLTDYEVRSFGIGGKFPLGKEFALEGDYQNLDLKDFDRTLEYFTIRVVRKW